jgi:RNA polymerase sigma-70 factor (ECF subfamily)
VLRIIGDRANAEEVMLDVYSQMWRSAARYDGTRGTPLAWMVTLARTRAIDRLRYAKHRAKHEDVLDRAAALPATTPTPERAAQSAEERRRVEEAIALLPDEQRVLVQLGFFAGLSHTEIAERLGVPLGTVKTRIRMAMVKLRETLKT